MHMKKIHRISIGLGVLVAALGAVLVSSPKALAHCCHPHPVAPYDSYCCHPSTTVYIAPAYGVVYIAPAYGVGVASVRGTARRTSRRTSRRVSRRR